MNQKLELEIINQFIVPSKKKRLSEFILKGNRDKAILALNSPGIFDKRYVKVFKGNDRYTPTLMEHYKQLGIGGRVYVMSSHSDWDTKKFQTSYILDEALGQCIDIIGYCWKTKKAFYEWHHSGESYFLSHELKQN